MKVADQGFWRVLAPFLALAVVACGPPLRETPAPPLHPITLPTSGLVIGYDDPAVAAIDPPGYYELLYTSTVDCMVRAYGPAYGEQIPPVVRVVGQKINGFDGWTDRRTLQITVREPAILAHEVVHYLLARVTGDIDGDHTHYPETFERCGPYAH